MYEDEEIEEVRELLYNLLKNYPAGATSTFLEEQYQKKYVETGIAAPLPKDWLRYIKLADEFEVKHQASFTMVYIVNVEGSSSSSTKWPMTDEPNLDDVAIAVLGQSYAPTTDQSIISNSNGHSLRDTKCAGCFALTSKLEPMALSSLPKVGAPVKVNVVSAMDPDNIFVRFCLWDPVPDYLYSALSRISNEQSEKLDVKIVPGELYAAKVNDCWERVQTVRKSAKKRTNNYWVVFAVDMGFFHILCERELRPLSVEVEAFKKIFLVKCRLHGVQPIADKLNESRAENEHITSPIKWSKETQKAMTELLSYSQSADVEFVPHKEWSCENNCISNNIPTSIGKFTVNGEDIGARLVQMELACDT